VAVDLASQTTDFETWPTPLGPAVVTEVWPADGKAEEGAGVTMAAPVASENRGGLAVVVVVGEAAEGGGGVGNFWGDNL
jgi:hypothetical protein